MTDPPPTSAVNTKLLEIVSRSRKLIIAAVFCVGVMLTIIGILAVGLTYLQINERDRVVRDVTSVVSSQCGFYYPIATSAPDPSHVTKVGVQLIEGSRLSMTGLKCQQTLPPPSPALLRAGRKFGVPITR